MKFRSILEQLIGKWLKSFLKDSLYRNENVQSSSKEYFEKMNEIEYQIEIIFKRWKNTRSLCWDSGPDWLTSQWRGFQHRILWTKNWNNWLPRLKLYHFRDWPESPNFNLGEVILNHLKCKLSNFYLKIEKTSSLKL